MAEHIVFFDGECPLCHRAVRHLIAIDTRRVLQFAPLSGKTAVAVLSGPQEALRHANTLVLAENYTSTSREFWIRSRAVFRVYWLIGGKWKWLGVICFFPGWIGDFFYRQIAAHRHQFKLKIPDAPGPEDRFLP